MPLVNFVMLLFPISREHGFMSFCEFTATLQHLLKGIVSCGYWWHQPLTGNNLSEESPSLYILCIYVFCFVCFNGISECVSRFLRLYLFLVSLLGLCSFCLSVSSYSNMLVSVLSYYILCITVLYPRSILIPNERQKWVGSGWEGRWQGIWKNTGRGNYN